MMHPDDFEILLPSFFSGKLSPEEMQIVEDEKNASEENSLIFKNAENVWKSLMLLGEMRTYNAPQALLKVNASIQKQASPGNEAGYNSQGKTTSGQALSKSKGFLFYWQRIAAILLLPVILSGIAYYFFNSATDSDITVWQTITTPPGVKSQVQLPDGTKVWLNSDTRLSYPVTFARNRRQVKLEGEAFFDVVKKSRQPFSVDLGKIGIEVTGTAFNAINYIDEKQTEVILTSGKINLLNQYGNKRRLVTEMHPGEKAIFRESSGKIAIQRVDTDKYTSWIHGRLVFRDDSMTEVVRRLNRWFNVEIEVPDPEIAQYVYTATFSDETIEQILDLFKRTSPVQYTLIPAPRNDDGSFGKQRIVLKPR